MNLLRIRSNFPFLFNFIKNRKLMLHSWTFMFQIGEISTDKSMSHQSPVKANWSRCASNHKTAVILQCNFKKTQMPENCIRPAIILAITFDVVRSISLQMYFNLSNKKRRSRGIRQDQLFSKPCSFFPQVIRKQNLFSARQSLLFPMQSRY